MNWEKNRYTKPYEGCKVKIIRCDDDWEDVPWDEGEILTLKRSEIKNNDKIRWYIEEYNTFIMETEFEMVNNV